MKQKQHGILYAKLFLLVFFLKMLASATPLIVATFDKAAANSAIMQLELEHDIKDNKAEKELSAKDIKEYNHVSGNFTFELPLRYINAQDIYYKDSKHIRIYYPAVPTPPPNA